MNEKELKAYEELKRIPYERLTETEKADFDRLNEKKETQDQIKSAMEDFFKNSELLKAQKQPDLSAKKEEELLNNPAYAMSKRLVGMKRGDRDMIKAADPILVSANDDAGGYLVPAVTQARIMELLPTYGQARKYMTGHAYGRERNIYSERKHSSYLDMGNIRKRFDHLQQTYNRNININPE